VQPDFCHIMSFHLRQAHGDAAVLKAAQSLGSKDRAPAVQLLAKHGVQPSSVAAAAAAQASAQAAAAPAVPSPGAHHAAGWLLLY